jgi:predicted metal-dependent HD superfamily phosphohydrolase
MMRNDVSGGPRSKYKKYEKMMRKNFQEVERYKFKKSEKMMRNDVSEGQRSKYKKYEKMMRKNFQEVERYKFKKSEKMTRKDVSPVRKWWVVNS